MKINTVSYCMLFLATVVMATFAVADSPVTTGLVKHVDASAFTGLNDSDPVSVWPDLAGYDDMVTYAGEPTYVTGVINGLPVVRFNGDGGLVATTETTHFSGDQPHTVFVVAIATEFSGNARCLWQIGRNSGGKYSSFALESASSIGNRMGNGYNKFIPSPPYVLGGADLFVSGYSGGGYVNYSLDINGAAIPANPNNPNNKMSMDESTIRVGNKNNDTASFNGDIAEVLFFNRSLSADEENEVGHYLATKYGLTTSYTEPTFYLLNYSPADGAQRVGQDTQLSWDAHGVDGTPTYKVYFGDEPNDVDPLHTPGPVTTTQDTFYAPTTALAPATVYYWRVEATVDSNSIEGDILTFTTGGDIANLSPDGSIGLATDELTISWAAESAESTYIDGYNVYLGETLPGTPTDTVTENQWMVSGLTDDTIYQCKVESLHDGSPVGEATVSFTTGKLAGYWPFDDNLTDIIDANDASRADPQYASGFINEGSAADFAGDLGNDPVVVPLLHAVGATANWTISFWEYSYADGGGWESILGCGTDNDGWKTFEFGRYTSNRYVFGLNQGGGYDYSPDDSSFLREGWHFHAISHNSEARTIDWYVDGGLIKTYTGTNVTLAPDLYVGNVKGLSQPFNGKVDDLKLYSRPLSAGQVLQAYIDGVNGAPINPVPASGSQDMPWDPTLQWILVEVPTGISIEVGKLPDLSDATPIALAADATSFDVLAGLGVKLDPSTGYFWRVTATYPAKTSAGPIWFFTVRDLLGDISGNLVVNTGDVPLMADMWLDDAFLTVPSGTEYDFVDQEVWGADPNLEDYDAYVTPGGPWGESKLSVKTDPTDPNGLFDLPSQTLLWTAWGEGQQLCGLVFPESVNFNDFDKFGFWAYQTGCSGNMQFRPIEEGTFNRPFTKTVYGFGSNNDKWHRYEWEIGAQASANIYKVDIWVAGTDFTIEYGNWYLVKDGVEVEVCLEENRIPEDLNSDCLVNLLDLAVMGGDWMLDASN
ncbi:MAG: hypothetical protein J7M40_19355 [Planctomycetes bacterium]|nr:hypothetical protein [Planctomycetota bacterium]